MQKNNLVSIIMPSYNTSQYIIKSIQSVQKQTYTNWELIIVDDCSTDDTDNTVLQVKDSRVRYLKKERNSGAAESRNLALREAKGKWIAFLDSDDLWKQDKLEKQIAFMEKNEYFFSYAKYEVIDENGDFCGLRVSGPKRIKKKRMYKYCWPGCLTVMYDRDRIGEIQIADLKKNNDYAMWLRVSEKADCYLLDEILGCYRKRRGSISNHSYIELVKWHYKLFRIEEKKNPISAMVYTFRNVFYGIVKKIVYVKKCKNMVGKNEC